jgi:hypothetical protein
MTLSINRHAELVSASMAGLLGHRSVCFEVRPWTLKQVQGDEEKKGRAI